MVKPFVVTFVTQYFTSYFPSGVALMIGAVVYGLANAIVTLVPVDGIFA